MTMCKVCGMSIPEAYSDCPNCAREKKDRHMGMSPGYVAPKVAPKVESTEAAKKSVKKVNKPKKAE